jgi:hypothetical protein
MKILAPFRFDARHRRPYGRTAQFAHWTMWGLLMRWNKYANDGVGAFQNSYGSAYTLTAQFIGYTGGVSGKPLVAHRRIVDYNSLSSIGGSLNIKVKP